MFKQFTKYIHGDEEPAIRVPEGFVWINPTQCNHEEAAYKVEDGRLAPYSCVQCGKALSCSGKWLDQVRSEYEAAGFPVETFETLPLVKIPKDFDDIVRFLSFRPTFGVSVQIFRQGAIIVPPGFTIPREG